jgi:hypothetical protein
MSLLKVLNKIMKTIKVKYKLFPGRLTEICVLVAEKPIYKILLKKRQTISPLFARIDCPFLTDWHEN